MKTRHKIQIIALAVLCLFAGSATTFVGLWDLWKITSPEFNVSYMDYVVMAAFTSMGLGMLALAAILTLNATWAFYIAITLLGITTASFTIAAFHTNVYFGISLLCGILFVVGSLFKRH